MSDVYVIGIGMIKFGRYPGSTVPELAAEAALLALDDTALTIKDVQSVYCGNLGEANAMVGQRMLAEIGQTGIPVTNVANACATGATAFREAWMSVAAGAYDLVLAVGVEQMGKGLLGGAPDDPPTEGVLGSTTMPAMFAQIGMEHSRNHGTTFEQFAKVSVKNHFHSTMNPKSRYTTAVSLEEVMSSEMIAYPNTKLMCSVNVDGSAATVLASARAVKRLGLTARAVRVRASAMSSNPFQARGMALPDFSAATRLAAADAYETAGIGPEDVDVIELHDCFATAELLHYENLGICADGDAGRLIDEGETQLGGRLPVNVSGGLLSKGHPLGATGIANIYEICKHLRKEGGSRQVEGARVGVTHVVGGGTGLGTACAVHIFEQPYRPKVRTLQTESRRPSSE